MNEILVDTEGLKQFDKELEKLQQQSLANSSLGTEVCDDAVGDGWHDNFAFEESMRQGQLISSQIDRMMQEQKLLVVVNYENMGDEYINIGDIVELEIKYDVDDIEKQWIKLTGKYLPDNDSDIQEVTLNSPIGKAVYHQKVFSSTSYIANNKEVQINILGKKN